MNFSIQHTKPASGKQTALIDSLLAERDYQIPAHLAGYANDVTMASYLIDQLFAAPRRNKTVQEAKAAARPAPGLYVLDGDVIEVRMNARGTGVYALRLIPSGTSARGTWDYEQGLIDQLQGATPASREDMVAYGRRTATCGICGAALTNPESIERGIGPICAGRI